jgi:hypothetical protein
MLDQLAHAAVTCNPRLGTGDSYYQHPRRALPGLRIGFSTDQVDHGHRKADNDANPLVDLGEH